MIKSFKLTVSAVLSFALSISACNSANASIVNYIRQDGLQTIRVERDSGNFSFTSGARDKSDLGGIVRSCDSPGILCLNLSGYFISIPKNSLVPNVWSSGGAEFTVVGHADRGSEKVYIVQVSVKGDQYMFYSFSKRRGIESISFQQEGATPDLAKTFFLVGEQGLLSGDAAVKFVHP